MIILIHYIIFYKTKCLYFILQNYITILLLYRREDILMNNYNLNENFNPINHNYLRALIYIKHSNQIKKSNKYII